MDAQSHHVPMQQLLPEFCRSGIVLRIFVLTQGLAIVLALVPGVSNEFWPRLGLTSIFLHWVTLLSAALLCLFRRRLQHASPQVLAWLTLLLLMLVTLFVSIFAYGFLQQNDWAQGDPFHLFLLKTMLIALLVGGMGIQLFSLYVQHSWRLGAQSRSELDALQARIQPHFLFNSLNAAAELTQTDAAAAEAALLDLAGLFRAAMHAGAEVSLGEELEISRQYLALERLRLEQRLQVAWDLPAEVPQIRVPCLTLQPLLENAVRHGIERCTNGGIISIQLVASARFATIVLVNPVGDNRQKHSGNGIALANIRRRLELMYGDGASLTTSSQDGQYRVKLVLPVQVFKAS